MTSMELILAVKTYLVTKNRYLKILAIIALVVGGFAANKFVDQKVESEVVAYFSDHKDELRGDKGDEGIAGEQGPQGGVGLAGAAGARGIAGAVGAKGSDGAKGEVGTKGSDGQDGCTAYYSYGVRYWYCP